MKLKPEKLAPVLIAVGVMGFVSLLEFWQPDLIERFERITYDLRVRQALNFHPPASTNLGFVYIDDSSIDFIRTNRVLGYRYGLQWPRQVYGRLVRELADEKAESVAFDVLFDARREDHPQVLLADGNRMESDDFFAVQLRVAGNVVLADSKELHPDPLFATNAMARGDITTDTSRDSDGVLRRAQAFHVERVWHPLFQQVAADPAYGVRLASAVALSNVVILPRSNGEEIRIPLDAEGRFELADFIGDNLPEGMAPKALPFSDKRVWHMGLVLAAHHLGLDLESAEVDLSKGRIVLRGSRDLVRTIPVEADGSFYIDWCLTPNDRRLTRQSIQDLLVQERRRLDGDTNGMVNRWEGRIAIVGSSATGNDLTDRGATPLENDTLLASGHWNVANSLITGRFVQRSSRWIDLLLIWFLGAMATFVTWRLRALSAFGLVAFLVFGYLGVAWLVYIRERYWIPVVLPVFGALLCIHLSLLIWRVVFEQAEQRRLKGIFSSVVSPKIMHELIKAERLSLGGARREVTIMFADVRGFTEFTDVSQERAEAYVRENQLSTEAAEAYFDRQARETLETVNLYLGLVAETVIGHDATLDKFIGDCVMAFWGAPTTNPQHACAGVRSAIQAQRAIYRLNQERAAENQQIEIENRMLVASGLTPRSLKPILLLGSGINTGIATVGLMGSESKAGLRQGNYTVFGREVNLASRLESLSGRGRILISETTFKHLQRDAPELAATCVSLPAATVKGIRSAVNVYEVPWREDGAHTGDTGKVSRESLESTAGFDSGLARKV